MVASSLSVADILDAAANLAESGWTKGAAARRAGGSPTTSTDPLAIAWCAHGAIVAATYRAGIGGADFSAVVNGAVDALNVPDVAAWNDDPRTCKADVRDRMRTAATMLRIAAGNGGASR